MTIISISNATTFIYKIIILKLYLHLETKPATMTNHVHLMIDHIHNLNFLTIILRLVSFAIVFLNKIKYFKKLHNKIFDTLFYIITCKILHVTIFKKIFYIIKYKNFAYDNF